MYGMGLIIVTPKRTLLLILLVFMVRKNRMYLGNNHSPESSYGEVEDGFQSKIDYITADF